MNPFRYFILAILLYPFISVAQMKTPKDFGFEHIEFIYNKDKVDILIKSKQGEEKIKKPILFFCQGSLPQPLIKFDENGLYGVFPFSPEIFLDQFHLVIVGKPYIPLIAEVKSLGNNYTYIDSTGKVPKAYSERNDLNYYVNRNIDIIKYLRKQTWVSNEKLILAGHSEGSTIAAMMAAQYSSISHLIYSGGNPMGRVMSIIQQRRAEENDSSQVAEMEFDYWKDILSNQESQNIENVDSYKTTYGFSVPVYPDLLKLNIPTMITYGSKDWNTPYVDFLRAEALRLNRTNMTFKAFIGTEHNYFPLNNDGRPNYNIYNWDNVATDWLKWINKK